MISDRYRIIFSFFTCVTLCRETVDRTSVKAVRKEGEKCAALAQGGYIRLGEKESKESMRIGEYKGWKETSLRPLSLTPGPYSPTTL